MSPTDMTKFVVHWKHEPKVCVENFLILRCAVVCVTRYHAVLRPILPCLSQVVEFGDSAPVPVGGGGVAAALPANSKPKPKEVKPSGPPPGDAGKKSGADAKGLEYTKAGNFPRWYEQVGLPRTAVARAWARTAVPAVSESRLCLVGRAGDRQVGDDRILRHLRVLHPAPMVV